MLSPQEFAKKAGLSYQQVLIMCKKSELDNTVQTKGGYYKIPEKNLNKFLKDADSVSKDEYIKVVRENEKLKTLISQMKNYIFSIDV